MAAFHHSGHDLSSSLSSGTRNKSSTKPPPSFVHAALCTDPWLTHRSSQSITPRLIWGQLPNVKGWKDPFLCYRRSWNQVLQRWRTAVKHEWREICQEKVLQICFSVNLKPEQNENTTNAASVMSNQSHWCIVSSNVQKMCCSLVKTGSRRCNALLTDLNLRYLILTELPAALVCQQSQRCGELRLPPEEEGVSLQAPEGRSML